MSNVDCCYWHIPCDDDDDLFRRGKAIIYLKDEKIQQMSLLNSSSFHAHYILFPSFALLLFVHPMKASVNTITSFIHHLLLLFLSLSLSLSRLSLFVFMIDRMHHFLTDEGERNFFCCC